MAAIDGEASLRSDGNVVLPGVSGSFALTSNAKGVGSSDPKANLELKAKLTPAKVVADAIGDKPRDIDLKLAWQRPRTGEPTLVASAVAEEGAPDQVSLELAASEPDRRKHAFAGLIERRGETIAVRLDHLRVTPPRSRSARRRVASRSTACWHATRATICP